MGGRPARRASGRGCRRRGPADARRARPSGCVVVEGHAGRRSGAGDRNRTGDTELGKLVLYQLSYARACEPEGCAVSVRPIPGVRPMQAPASRPRPRSRLRWLALPAALLAVLAIGLRTDAVSRFVARLLEVAIEQATGEDATIAAVTIRVPPAGGLGGRGGPEPPRPPARRSCLSSATATFGVRRLPAADAGPSPGGAAHRRGWAAGAAGVAGGGAEAGRAAGCRGASSS